MIPVSYTHLDVYKRQSYEDLIDQGFLTESVINFVALLGWSPEDNNEFFTLDELVKEFDYHHMSKTPAVFDMTKLRWMNGEYLKKMDFDKFYEMALPHMKEVVSRAVSYTHLSLYQAAIRSKLLFVSEDESWPIQQSARRFWKILLRSYQTLR